MRKCNHGIFWPEDQPVALYCQFCNPKTNDAPSIPGREIPKFNRRGSLSLTQTGRLPKCPNCKGTSLLTVSGGGVCSICKTEYEIIAPKNLRANIRQPGLCECGSGIHYERNDGKTWICADCGRSMKTPRRSP